MQEIDFHRALVPNRPPGTIIDVGAHDGRLALDLAAIPALRMLALRLPSWKIEQALSAETFPTLDMFEAEVRGRERLASGGV